MRRYSPRGVTLIEVLLVSALISMIGLAIYSGLSSGIRVWENASRWQPEIDAHILIDAFSTDLNNFMVFSQIPFSGQQDAITFAAFGSRSPGSTGAGFGTVSYCFDKGAGILTRRFCDFKKRLQQGDSRCGQGQVTFAVEGCSFEYYYVDATSRQGRWLAQIKGSFPQAVKITVTVKNQNAPRVLSKIVPVNRTR